MTLDEQAREIERQFRIEQAEYDATRPLAAEEIWGHTNGDGPLGDYGDATTNLPNNTAGLLSDVQQLLSRFVAFPSVEACDAAAAWVLHVWVLDAFDSSPRLAALSPEKGSGKTRLLEILDLVVPNAKHTVNMSAAVLFRLVGGDEPVTLLMDEADTYLGWRVSREHEDVRGLVNAGHRRGATAYRMKMEGGAQVQEFPAFAPVALAGIGDLPDTIIDRSIVISMKRRAPSERIEQFRRRLVEPDLRRLIEGLRAWGESATKTLAEIVTNIVLPSGIEDRAADVWESLVAIGDLAGSEWSPRIRNAATTLNAERLERDPSLGVQLLHDIRELFHLGAEDRVTSQDLVSMLVTIEGSPWSNIKGQAIDANALARRLKPYGIRPDTHRFGPTSARGYLKSDFYDNWERYLPPRPTHNSHNTHDIGPLGVTDVMAVTPSTGGEPPSPSPLPGFDVCRSCGANVHKSVGQAHRCSTSETGAA